MHFESDDQRMDYWTKVNLDAHWAELVLETQRVDLTGTTYVEDEADTSGETSGDSDF
jgi:hypothetical protein